MFQVAYQGLSQKISYVSGCIPGAVSKDSGAIPWQDVIVTEMKEGGIFWAHIGEDTMKRVAEVQAALNKGGLERVDRVLKGESVAVFGKIQDTPCFLRAEVGIGITILNYLLVSSVNIILEEQVLPDHLNFQVAHYSQY